MFEYQKGLKEIEKVKERRKTKGKTEIRGKEEREREREREKKKGLHLLSTIYGDRAIVF